MDCSHASQQLCKETHQLAVEASLFNEYPIIAMIHDSWMMESIVSMKNSIKRIEFLERRMKNAMEAVRSTPSS